MPLAIKILLLFCSVLGALITFVIVRAIMFRPEKKKISPGEDFAIDTERAVQTLSEMIRCRTVSSRNKEEEDEAEFLRFEQLLPTLFPSVFEKCSFEKVTERALLLKWKGRSSDSPTVLMAHYDVVSVAFEDWEKPPFDAVLENGVLWGRGALDTKGTLNGILSAAEKLISEGFVPKNDIYFAFGGDEEINGTGALSIVSLFKQRKITPALVLDEGGAVVEKVFPGVSAPCALIGIAEKGMLNVEYSVKGGGGHSSSPAPHTPVGRLSASCVKVEGSPFKYRLSEPAKKMLDTLGRNSTFLYRVIFANLWLFSPLLNLLTKKTGGELNALVRTTTAFTQMEGSKGMNVIPPYAKMVSNHRIIAPETTDSVLKRIRKIVKDDNVEIKMIDGMNPSRISKTDCEGYERVKEAVSDTWQDAIVSPYLMLACSDSRHWGDISDRVYRFSAMALSKEERKTIHGNNERIPVATVIKAVEFFTRIMKRS